MKALKAAVKLRVRGIVHGVFFRATMAELAQEARLSGWVRNVEDGSVEALLEGEQESVDRVVRWAKRGPPGARVDSVQVERAEVSELRGFKITG